MDQGYIKLIIAAFLPVIGAALMYIADKNTPFGKLRYGIKQVILGVIFGGFAVLGTEWGIPLNGAQVNCRDAAVLIAGLMFGSPAGIIAGLIGGIERWIAVFWGVGTFTRIACSVSTAIAGFYSAVLRKYMFENKKPGWMISLAIGIVMEVFHLTMVFITNMHMPNEAMAVVKSCSAPMILANGLSVMLAAVIVTVLAHEKLISDKRDIRISQTVQKWLLLTVVSAFLLTTLFVYKLQSEIADVQTKDLLKIANLEIQSDITDSSNENLLKVAWDVKNELGTMTLKEIAEEYGIAEIHIIDENGIIVKSTVPSDVGFDMNSGEQAREFLCLLNGKSQYVQEYGPISNDPSRSRKYAGVKLDSGFLQIGYDSVQFQRDIDTQVVGITKNRHVGKSGFVAVVDENMKIVSAPERFMLSKFQRKDIPDNFNDEKIFNFKINGMSYLCMAHAAEGYIILSFLPAGEAYQIRNIVMYVNTFMEVLAFALLFAFIYFIIKKVVVNQIDRVNESLGRITGGDLNEIVNVRTNAEFASLSDDINSTVDTLKKYIAEASARIDKELEFAKNIQESALPSVFPAFPHRKEIDIFASMHPAKEVGGDFYDFYLTNEKEISFLIADVSGKGIPAAMFMMRAKTQLKSLTEAGNKIDEVFTKGNAGLCEGNDAGMFVTAWQGKLDLETGNISFANAGHNPPVIRKNGGKFEYLTQRPGFVLAGMDGVKYRENSLVLEPGDIIYLYTDGVTEATNKDSELFGEERLLNAMNSCTFSNMNELCEKVKVEIDAFVGDAPQFDDITMVALRYEGKMQTNPSEGENGDSQSSDSDN